MSTRRVFLHIGAPKTGTTYLQDRWLTNRESLQKAGVRYPIGLRSDMFLPALDLIQRPWGGMLERAGGEWDGLVRRTLRGDDDVLISHEILAGASAPQVARAMKDLADLEVHVIYTARDLARQIPAEWQEHVKHRGRTPYTKYLAKLEQTRLTPSEMWFWRVQSLPDVLTRWSANLEPSRIHLVTVPQKGAPRDELWNRFCRSMGVDPAAGPQESERANQSMGAAETTLVRKLNRRLKGELGDDDYRRLVRQTLAHQHLSQRSDMQKVTVAPEARGWADEMAERAIEWAEGAGVDVVGDLAELTPIWPTDEDERPWQNPDKADAADVLDAALDALVVSLKTAAERQDPHESAAAKAGRLVKRLGS
ncbi:hypothetical protein [Nocardioides sp. GY 10127]|uniref:hypothetical protein n=1 Tax=Nocardioides sp. GY 10127 TaxID=2569762 RepID=UPI0010A77205|nr:hypothetical protein [Nocardioides sp. GY 10127]TIC82723.1 hypothetical protein E8D37_08505 [Nocardioides sp. GY 10127]